MRLLQRKKVGMSTGTIKNAIVPAYFIHKKPIRFYMQLPVWFPLTFEGMITTNLGQLFLIKQKHNYRFQLLHIVAAMFHLSQITAELSGKSGITHLYPQLPEKVLRILGVKYFLSPLRFLYGFTGQGIGNFLTERKALFSSNSRQRHTQCIRNSKPPIRKDGTGFVLDDRINSGTNNGVGRHIFSPFEKCSPNVRIVKYHAALSRRECHGLI